MRRVEVAGATTEVDVEVAVPAERMWDLVTDVERIGEWSPEVFAAEWLERSGPRPGARSLGRNRPPGGDVTCVVTEAERPGVFAWVVLTQAMDRIARARSGGTSWPRARGRGRPVSATAWSTGPAPPA